MAGLMDSVNQRTQLVGQNRLELLLFRLEGPQLYGINVFKVKEVLQCPNLTIMPKSSRVVRGVANIRGGTIPILDLSIATGRAPLEDIKTSFVIITEYNTKVQGFLVRSVAVSYTHLDVYKRQAYAPALPGRRPASAYR